MPAAAVTFIAGAVGVYDDIVGSRPQQRSDKGLRGHLSALRDGRITAGTVKIGALAAAGIACAGPVSRGPLDRLVAGGVIAGTANLLNLFDLRPGRALKVTIAGAAAGLGGPAGGVVAGTAGAAAALLGPDLQEQAMIGDGGANAIGALLGLRLAAAGGPLRRSGALGAIAALTLASERSASRRSSNGRRSCGSWTRSAGCDDRRPRGAQIARAATVIAVLTVLARIAGFGRNLVFARTVGNTCLGQTYQSMNTIPNIVFEIVAGGALAGVVVPMLAGHRARRRATRRAYRHRRC